MKSPNKDKKKFKHLPKPSPVDKMKLRGATASSAKADYYAKKVQHHVEAAQHHEDMADKGIHKEYHEDKAKYHRDQIAKIKQREGTKKDIGPMGSAPGITGTF